VVVNEIIAVCFLKEPLRKRDLLGLVGVVAGVVLIILGVPESKGEIDVHNLLSSESLLAPRSCWYLLFLVRVNPGRPGRCLNPFCERSCFPQTIL